MRTTTKKLLTLLLVLIMCMGLMTVGVSAAEETSPEETAVEETTPYAEENESVTVPEDEVTSVSEDEAVPEALTQSPDDGIALVDDTTYTWSGNISALSVSENGTITISGDGTLTLTADTMADVKISSGTVTINLGGYTLANSSDHTITVDSNATLTITGNGTVDNVTHQKAAVYNYGTVTIEGGTFTRSQETIDPVSGSANSWYLVVNEGTMTISDGVFYTGDGTSAGYGNRSSLIRNGNSSGEDGTLTINGGTFTNAGNVLKNETVGSTITITNGSFIMDNSVNKWYGGNNAIMNCGTLTMTGGEVILEGTGISGNEKYAAGTYLRYAITTTSNSEASTELSDVTVTVSGNNSVLFKSSNGTTTVKSGTYSVDTKDTDYTSVMFGVSDGITFTVSGGEFTSDPLDANNVSVNEIAVSVTEDGNTVYYVGTADEVIEYLAKNASAGSTVTVLQVDEEEELDLDEAGLDQVKVVVAEGVEGTVIVNGTVVNAGNELKSHNADYVEEVAATCTAAGNIAYYYCADCDSYFSDKACTEEITKADTVIAATGHVWGDISWSWDTSKENIGAKASWTCSECGENYTTTDVTVTSSVNGDITKYNLSAVGPDGETYTTTFTVGGGVSDPNDGTNTSSGASPQTGDATNMALWTTLMCLALAGIGGGSVLKLKQRGAGKHNKK